MSESILKVKNLNVELGREKVIEDLSFDLAEKEILVILGPNGAGKSVLLRTLLGLHAFKGEISWKKNIHIGYVPDDFDVPPDL
ncbi:MAG: zinc ABC transporter ATP-binding protein ZnuC, partial [Parcubacteria group bacterium CG_4_10_14_0_8_um_filter_35_7]